MGNHLHWKELCLDIMQYILERNRAVVTYVGKLSRGDPSPYSRDIWESIPEKPYSCEICGKAFSLTCSLKYHMVTHMNPTQHTGEKPASFDICGKLFTRKSKSGVDRHMKVHTGEKPYNCEICGKSFSFKYGVKSHMITHMRMKSLSVKKKGS